MSEFIEVFCSSIIIGFSEIYIWNKLLKEKIKLLSLKTFILVFLSSIVISINYIFNNPYLRIICITFFFSIIIKLVYRKTYVKSLSVAVFGHIILMMGDIIFALFLLPFGPDDINKFKNMYFANIYCNLGISIVSIFPEYLCHSPRNRE